jgi:hypothetical protein
VIPSPPFRKGRERMGHPAMGGELKITARFPEGTVEINQFEAVGKAHDRED